MGNQKIFEKFRQEFEKIDHLRTRITHPKYHMREVVPENNGKKENDLNSARAASPQDAQDTER